MALKVYRLTICLPERTEIMEVRQIGSYEFDMTFGFSGITDWDDMSKMKLLIEKMAGQNSVKRFWEILDINRKYSFYYKNDLRDCLMNIHLDSVELSTSPSFIYISQEVKYDGNHISFEKEGSDYSYASIENYVNERIEKIMNSED